MLDSLPGSQPCIVLYRDMGMIQVGAKAATSGERYEVQGTVFV